MTMLNDFLFVILQTERFFELSINQQVSFKEERKLRNQKHVSLGSISMDDKSNLLGLVTWPDEANIVKVSYRNPTVTYIEKLFYNTGTIALLAYLFIKSIIIPSLSVSYGQRSDLSVTVLLELRKLISSLQLRLKYTPVSALGFNEHEGKVERSVQTCDVNHQETRNEAVRWKGFRNSLQDLTTNLENFNEAVVHGTYMDSFAFQMKLLVDELQSQHPTENNANTSSEVISSIREVKGWFVNGRIS